MKNAKKLLSLVLVLVLAMSLIPFASAKPAAKNYDDYPDFESFDEEYIEAIDVLTALGILVGDEFGTFGADNTFTRGQAAKVITYIMIGTAAADRLQPAGPRFTDVPLSHWANPFVEYCGANDVIVGYGDGTFHPEAPVTASQLSKMLLIAIGYGAQDEYVGERWQHNAIVDGQNKKILDTGVDYTAPARRDEMARYVFNALTKPWVVTYNPALFGYYDGSQIWGTDSERQTLGQKTFKLYDRYSVDNLGYGVREWKLGSQFNANSITYTYKADTVLKAEGAKYTSTNGTEVTGVNSLTRVTSKNFCGYQLVAYKDANGVDVPIEYYINGTNLAGLIEENPTGGTFKYTNYFTGAVGISMTYAAAMDAAIASINAAADKTGVIVDLIDRNEDGNADKVIVIVKTGAALSSNPVVNDVLGTVRIAGLQNGEATPTGDIIGYRNPEAELLAGTPSFEKGTIDYEGFKAGDIVLYYIDGFGKYHLEHPETVVDKLTDYYTTQYLAQFGDNRYSPSQLKLLESISKQWVYDEFVKGDPYNYNRPTTAYLDDNGSIFAFVLLSIPVPDYLVLLDATVSGYDVIGHAIFMDGTESTKVKIASVSNADGKKITPLTVKGTDTRDLVPVLTENSDVATQNKLNAGSTTFFAALRGATTAGLSDRSIYSYTIDDDGEYHLVKPYTADELSGINDTDASTTNDSAYKALAVDDNLDNRSIAATMLGADTTADCEIETIPEFFGGSSYNTAGSGTLARLGARLVADDDTVFVFRDNKGKVSFCVGYKNLPEFIQKSGTAPFGIGEAVSFVPYPADSALTIAKLVFLNDVNLTSTSKDQLMFVNLAGFQKTGGKPYYEGLAVDTATDTLIKVKIDENLFKTILKNGVVVGTNKPYPQQPGSTANDAKIDYPSVLYNVEYTNGVITNVELPDNLFTKTTTNSAYGTGVPSYKLDGAINDIALKDASGKTQYYGINSATVKVYEILSDRHTTYAVGDLVLLETGEIFKDENAMWFAKLNPKDKAQITELFIVYKDVTTPTQPPVSGFTVYLTGDDSVGVVGNLGGKTYEMVAWSSQYLTPDLQSLATTQVTPVQMIGTGGGNTVSGAPGFVVGNTYAVWYREVGTTTLILDTNVKAITDDAQLIALQTVNAAAGNATSAAAITTANLEDASDTSSVVLLLGNATAADTYLNALATAQANSLQTPAAVAALIKGVDLAVANSLKALLVGATWTHTSGGATSITSGTIDTRGLTMTANVPEYDVSITSITGTLTGTTAVTTLPVVTTVTAATKGATAASVASATVFAGAITGAGSADITFTVTVGSATTTAAAITGIALTN